MVESGPSPILSWKDKLMGNKSRASDKLGLDNSGAGVDEDLEFLEGDIHISIINGIPAIDFSERIQQILFKEMEHTVVLKLLGRNIGYGALNNRISSLWNPSKPFHIMDIENEYFLAKFQSTDNYAKVLSQGPWLIYGQYLTVQPWTKEFNPYNHTQAWKILEEIGGTIGKVVRLDFNTDSRITGHFARIAVYVNLDKPLIAQVLVNVTVKDQKGYYSDRSRCKRRRRRCLRAMDGGRKEKVLVDLEDELNKEDTRKLVVFKNKLKVGENVAQQGFKTRGRTPVEPTFDIGAVRSTTLKAVMDPLSSSMNQPNDVSDPHYIESALQNNKPRSSFHFLNDSAFKVLTGAEVFKSSTNHSKSTPVTVSCFNPIFVGQEVSENGGPALSTKPVSSL
ncbi:hypothetical protein GOBAR_AA21936 [Gossypium barbadense]|uniref:DUF4283 domain-containing protein n=1 Tax=Gossypium barbadense TaxID=3634 RepID=A0A2P5X5X5_GOSBA|nr:hypothetical protein GOBAR_AA21936 [Gossypium barbadense]